MKLDKKKQFIANVLGIGKGRIVLNTNRLADIKEAMTRQDVKDLLNDGAIFIKDIHGRAKVERRKNRRRAGSKKKFTEKGKKVYMRLTRKLRAYLAELKRKSLITPEVFKKLRQEIRAHSFKSKTHLKERMGVIGK
jgi:large subunit ribosomal protein L19e